MAAHVRESTISDWRQKLDPLWISVKRDDNGTTLTCKLCTQYENRLKHARNFSRNFIVGIYGTTLNKDNVVKHKRSEQHLTAERIHNKPQNLLEIYSSTKIDQAVTKAESGERQRVGRLVDIAYMIAKTGSSFKKYSPIIDIEKKPEVDLGQTYHNDMACREFISCIHEVMENDLKSELVNANYISLLTDGSTDSGIVEKELMYLIFLDKSGTLRTVFFGIKNVVDGTARGLKELIDKAFCDFGLVNYKQRLIGLGADGATVNMGAKNGLAALLRSDGMPWLVAVHCFNHRLELAMKDALGKTYMAEIDRVLMLLYYQYHNSPKKLREFRELGNIMQISVTKPKKSHGTRWVQNKLDAINALIKDYEAIVSHFETQIVGLPNKNTSKEFGILKKLKQFQFVIHLLFFGEILKPVARLSVTWQKDSISMPQVLVALKNLKITLDQMSSSIVSDSSVTVCDHLHRDSSALLNETENDDKDISFKNIQLQNIATGKKHFLSNRSSYIEQIQKACENRMKIDDTVLGCSQILDTRLWPADELQLGQFGKDKIVMLLNHFKEILSTPEGQFRCDGRTI